MKALSKLLLSIFAFVMMITLFQNCSPNKVSFQDDAKLGALGVCDGISCDLAPLTFKPAVTTILLALGDEANDQLVVNGASSQLIAETVIRYTSPISNPRILLVRDSGAGNESPEDTLYIKNVLLSRYNVTYFEEPSSGLKPEDLQDYDIVWFNNPGAPMGSVNSRNVLMNFEGGVIIQGDDLSWGTGFTNEDLTGLKYIDNGVSVLCDDGKSYAHDNNAGNQYRVTVDAAKIPGVDSSTIQFKYGNDIDNTSIARSDLEVLAWAQGGPAVCTAQRPAIVRYIK